MLIYVRCVRGETFLKIRGRRALPSKVGVYGVRGSSDATDRNISIEVIYAEWEVGFLFGVSGRCEGI